MPYLPYLPYLDVSLIPSSSFGFGVVCPSEKLKFMMPPLFVLMSFSRELPEVFMQYSCSMKPMLFRDGRIQVASLKIGDESFEKIYASSNDAEMHHYSK